MKNKKFMLHVFLLVSGILLVTNGIKEAARSNYAKMSAFIGVGIALLIVGALVKRSIKEPDNK